jgi:hypothetical protein
LKPKAASHHILRDEVAHIATEREDPLRALCIYTHWRVRRSEHQCRTSSFLQFCALFSRAIVGIDHRSTRRSSLTLVRETAAEENSTAYFPILDRITEGYFAKASTDQELYTSFLELLRSDGHITDPATLSSFQFALSVRSAAPRIEAHYQFYNTSVEPSLQAEQGADCEVWVAFGGKQYCSPRMDNAHGDIKGERWVSFNTNIWLYH